MQSYLVGRASSSAAATPPLPPPLHKAIDEYGRAPYYTEQCAATLAVAYSSGSSTSRSITTTDLHGGCTAAHSGTSAAAPVAAGIIALVLEARPELTWRDMQHLIVRTGYLDDSTTQSSDCYTNAAGYTHCMSFGFGTLLASDIVDLASSWVDNVANGQRLYQLAAPQCTWTSPKITRQVLHGTTLLSSSEVVVADAANRVTTLEHVEVYVEISSTKRGEIEIDLACPSGTPSQLMPRRQLDTSSTSLVWTMMTVRCWGESPVGVFSLNVTSPPSANTVLTAWQLILYGTHDGRSPPSPPSPHSPGGGGAVTTTIPVVPVTRTSPRRTTSATPRHTTSQPAPHRKNGAAGKFSTTDIVITILCLFAGVVLCFVLILMRRYWRAYNSYPGYAHGDNADANDGQQGIWMNSPTVAAAKDEPTIRSSAGGAGSAAAAGRNRTSSSGQQAPLAYNDESSDDELVGTGGGGRGDTGDGADDEPLLELANVSCM